MIRIEGIRILAARLEDAQKRKTMKARRAARVAAKALSPNKIMKKAA